MLTATVSTYFSSIRKIQVGHAACVYVCLSLREIYTMFPAFQFRVSLVFHGENGTEVTS
jgi:hypothetical protein